MMQITCVADWHSSHTNLIDQMNSMRDWRAKQDVLKIYQGLALLIRELSKEEVVCRRMHKSTIRHQELLQKINERIAFFEEMVFFGTLAT